MQITQERQWEIEREMEKREAGLETERGVTVRIHSSFFKELESWRSKFQEDFFIQVNFCQVLELESFNELEYLMIRLDW